MMKIIMIFTFAKYSFLNSGDNIFIQELPIDPAPNFPAHNLASASSLLTDASSLWSGVGGDWSVLGVGQACLVGGTSS